MRRVGMLLMVLISVWLLLAVSVCGQDARGTLLGRVTDTSGGLVPGAEVSVVSNRTGVAASTVTNDVGNYRLPFLIGDVYTLTVELPGFKRYVRQGIQIRVGDQVVLDVVLEVGEISEVVEVRAETPLLEAASPTAAQVIDQRRILALPLKGGNPQELVYMAPGVLKAGAITAAKAPLLNTQTAIAGAPGYTNEFLLDGVSNTVADNGLQKEGFRPPTAAVAEFRIQSTPYDASVGHTMGGVVTLASTSGGNAFHGELHYIHVNSALNAASFNHNRMGTGKPPYKDHQYGFSAGGPVFLPKLYNGTNKSFWFYTFEGNKWQPNREFTRTVPTVAQRTGDFSALLNLPNPGQYQLYDPLTTTRDGTLFRREPLPNNIIPPDRVDPVARKMAAAWPLPNQPGNADGTNNFYLARPGDENYWVQMMRFDHAFSERHRAYVRVNLDHWNEFKNHFFGDYSVLNIQRRSNGIVLDDVYTVSPSMVLNLRYGINYHIFNEARGTKGFDLSTLGFSQDLIKLLVDPKRAVFPGFNVGTYGTLSEIDSGDGQTTALTHNAYGSLNKMAGSHQVTFGADYRVYRAQAQREHFGVSPYFWKWPTYVNGPLSTAAAPRNITGLASALFGIPAGQMSINTGTALQDQFLALFIQDDFKVTRKLTLNLGLRYEYETPMTERFDRLVAGFAFDQVNPIQAQVLANYAASAKPVPEVPLSDLKVLGGLTFVNDGGLGRSPFRGERNNFMPRIGFAYQLLDKTILRGGFGLFYDTLGVNTQRAITSGFTRDTIMQASLDNGLTWTSASFANPLPDGLLPVKGSSDGLMTYLGQNITFYRPELKQGYAQKWSFGIQRLLPGSVSLTTSYVGSRGVRLHVSRRLNETPPQYLSTSPTRDQATLNYLSASFPSPFFGIDPIYGANITRANMLKPYPHFGNISAEEPIGYSWYHAMQTMAERRFSGGFTIQASHTWSKLMQATSFLNPTDPSVYERIGDFDRTHRLTSSGIWEIPLGRGRRFGSALPAILNGVLGGWQLAGVYQIQSGSPLGFGNVIFEGDVSNIKLPKSQRTRKRWFNTDAGFNKVSSQQLASNIRTFSPLFSFLRSDKVDSLDFSLQKDFPIREKVIFHLRIDAFNAANHASFAGPNMSPTASNFGECTGLMNEPRNIYVSAKISW
jgi:hypothetical protein